MGEQGEPAGAAAEAIQAAELSLARQNSAAAQIDLQLVTAILNAHTARADGAGDLARLQSDVESAVATRTDLDTPAGARAFQRYLISRLRDIRAVVETAELDSTSKATLSAALAALYASATPAEEPGDSRVGTRHSDTETAVSADSPADLGFGSAPANGPSDALPTGVPTTPAAATPSPPVASWTGTPPGGSGVPSIGALPSPGSLGGLGPSADGLGSRDRVYDEPDHRRDIGPGEADTGAEDRGDIAQPDADTDPVTDSELPSTELAAVITAVVAGTPIPEAFAQQGIVIPPAGSPVSVPIDPSRVVAGDVGILADRHALALGNGKALLDNMIQPISAIGDRGLFGWIHPVKSTPDPPVPVPALPTP